MIEIDSYENLYSYANQGIIQYINEKIEYYGNIKKLEKSIDNIFDLINENSEFLKPEDYRIIPNQLGEFKKLDELYRDDNIFEELKDIISGYENIKESLMDKRIKDQKFMPKNIKNNNDIMKKINDLIEDKDKKLKKNLILKKL